MNYYNNSNNYRNDRDDLEVHKKSDKIKWIVVFASLVLLLILVIAALATAAGANGKAEENAEQTEKTDGRYGMVVGESGHTDGMLFKCNIIPETSYALYGVPRYAETAYNVEVTVMPDDADDKSVDWDLKWKNAESEWADGKAVTDYLTITPDGDGALSAVLACTEAFGEQALLTVTSRDNPDACDSLPVDYNRRVENITLLATYGGDEHEITNGSVALPFGTDVTLDYRIERGIGTKDVAFEPKEILFSWPEDFWFSMGAHTCEKFPDEGDFARDQGTDFCSTYTLENQELPYTLNVNEAFLSETRLCWPVTEGSEPYEETLSSCIFEEMKKNMSDEYIWSGLQMYVYFYDAAMDNDRYVFAEFGDLSAMITHVDEVELTGDGVTF